ncbi:MAG: hypothetical protein ACK5PZ_08550 [Pirellula sp.]|jgi:hypothetical protein
MPGTDLGFAGTDLGFCSILDFEEESLIKAAIIKAAVDAPNDDPNQ